MYGGHITDAWDRRTNNTYLEVLVNDKLFSGLELGPAFKSPDPTTLDYAGYITYVQENLPDDSPQMFGLHPNAEIGYLTNWTGQIFSDILSLGGGGGGGGGSTDGGAKATMLDLMERLPENYSMIEIQEHAKPLLSGESGPFVSLLGLQLTQKDQTHHLITV
jgi:dynein heavy chain